MPHITTCLEYRDMKNHFGVCGGQNHMLFTYLTLHTDPTACSHMNVDRYVCTHVCMCTERNYSFCQNKCTVCLTCGKLTILCQRYIIIL